MNDPYTEGRQAFLDDKKLKDNPYKDKQARRWTFGWYYERNMNEKLP